MARLNDLRRRLYRADATEADRLRYEAALQATRPPEAPLLDAAQARLPRPGRRAAVGLVVVLVTVGLVVAVRLGQPVSLPPRPVVAEVLRQDRTAGRLLTAGVSGPAAVAASIRGVAVTAQRFQGRGDAVVPFAAPAGASDGGRVLVVLASDGPATIGWRAVRLRTSVDWTSHPVAMARGSAEPGAVVATPITFVYSGSPPAQIAVDAPDGVGWTLLIAATGELTAALR